MNRKRIYGLSGENKHMQGLSMVEINFQKASEKQIEVEMRYWKEEG